MLDLNKENSNRVGKCQYCKKTCENVCSACKAWYCSGSCIKIDWIKHKDFCNPRTIHVDKYEESIKCRQDVIDKNVQYNNQRICNIEHPIRKTSPIPTDKYVKVVVSWIDKPFYWVFKYDDLEAQHTIEGKLNVYCASSTAERISLDDKKCCALYEGGWYRSDIISKGKDMAVVRFIDFGDSAFIKLTEALKIPEDLLQFKPMAFKVSFANSVPYEITVNTALNVKAIEQYDDICEVQIQGIQKEMLTHELYMPLCTVSIEASYNSYNRTQTNSASAYETDLKQSFNNEQGQNIGYIRNSPQTINERETCKNKDQNKEQNYCDVYQEQSSSSPKETLKMKDIHDVDESQVSIKVDTPHIPTDTYIKIVVSWIDEHFYWVFKFDDLETQSIIEEKLNVYCTSTTAERISLNENKCCAPFDGAWYRAKIFSKYDDTAFVRFIDFGNDGSIKLSDALKVPEELLQIKPLAFKVRFVDENPNQITVGSACEVKGLRKVGDIYEVQTKGYSLKNETLPVVSSPPSTVTTEASSNSHESTLTNGTSDYKTNDTQESNNMRDTVNLPGSINEREKISAKENLPHLPTDRYTKIVISWKEESFYWAFRFVDTDTQAKIEQKLNVHCTSTQAELISPDDNKCCALFDSCWYRAKILKKDDKLALVRFIDFGNDGYIKLTQALKIPEEFLRVKPLAFKIKFSGKNEFKFNDSIDVKSLRQDGDICIVEVHESEMLSDLPPSIVSIEGLFNRHDDMTEKTDHNQSVNTEPRQNECDQSKSQAINEIGKNNEHLRNINQDQSSSCQKESNLVDKVNIEALQGQNIGYSRNTTQTINDRETCENKYQNKEQNNCDVYQERSSSSPKETLKMKDIQVDKTQVSIKLDTPHIPTDTYIKIVISWVDEHFYWAFKFDDLETQSIIEEKLNVYCTSTTAERISLNENKCCAPFDGAWYRAKILSKDNDTACVRFIDFGNDGSIKLSDALKAPEELLQTKPLAFKVRFVDENPNQITVDSACEVKALRKDGDIYEVQTKGYPLKNETLPVVSSPSSTVTTEASSNGHNSTLTNGTSAYKTTDTQESKNIRDTVNLPESINEREKLPAKENLPHLPTDRYTKIVISWKEESFYWAFKFVDIDTQDKIEQNLNVHCTSTQAELISTDDNKCCALFDGCWYRAKILKREDKLAFVRFVDFGNEGYIKLTEALKIPEEFLRVKPLAFKIRFSDQNEFKFNDSIDVKALRQDGEVCVVQIHESETLSEIPPTIVSVPPNVNTPIPTDQYTKIVISWGEEPIYWAFKFDDTKIQSEIEEKLNVHCTSNRAELISPDDNKCCALFDGCWYRAKILKRVDNLAFVRYVDFGNEGYIKLTEALKIPEEFLRVEPLAFMIRFSDENEFAPNDSIDVKALRQDGEVCVVQIRESESLSEIPPSIVSIQGSLNRQDITEKTVHKQSLNTEPSPQAIHEMDQNTEHLLNVNQNLSSPCQTEIVSIEDKYVDKGNIPPKVNTPIPTDKFTKIVLSWGEEPIYWAFKFDDTKTQSEIEEKLNVHCRSNQAELISPYDNKCCAPINDCWYRGKILKRDDDTVFVHFVDYGNDGYIKLTEALKIPEEFLRIKPLAFKIRFLDEESHEFTLNDTIDVIAVNQEADVCVIQFKEYPKKIKTFSEIDTPSSTDFVNDTSDKHHETNSISFNSAMLNTDELTMFTYTTVNEIAVKKDEFTNLSDNNIVPPTTCIVNDIIKGPPRNQVLPIPSTRICNHLINQIEPSLSKISVQIQTLVGENCTTGFILADDTLKNVPEFKSIKDIADELSITKADPEFKPSLMDEVCARVGEIWYRGLVTLINSDKTNVALVDIGVIVVPDALAPLPQHVKSIVVSAVRCIFSTPQKTNLVGGQIVLKNLYKEAGKLIGDTDKFGQVAILSWEPTCEDAGLKIKNIKSETLYKISAFHSPNEIYLQSNEQNEHSRFFELKLKVIWNSQIAPSVRPWCGQLISCWSSKHDTYARAQVLKQLDHQYLVKFIDYGLIETVDLSKIKPLSDQLKSVPCFATKVGLKGIPGSFFNNEAIKIMNQLMDKDSLLTVAVENNDPTKIRLFEGEREINKHIYESMFPSCSSQNQTDSVIFMSNEILHEKWLSGQNMRLYILDINAFNEIVVINEETKVFAHAVSMTTEIEEFCSSDATSYTPRVQEMCLAKFEDDKWYRALCIASNKDTTTVYYIDFGNYSQVSHTDIRKMLPKFLDYPTGTKTCKIYGLSDSLPDVIKEKMVSEYSDGHVECTVVCDNNDGSAVLYIPKFMDILLQHSLTSVTPPPAQFLMPTTNF